MLARLAGDEEQRNQRGVGDRLVEVPDDLGQCGDELSRADHLGDVPGTIASAEATATSISENPSRSKPVVNVISRGLCRIASAAIAVESIPPERNAPTVTSARMCLATQSSSTAVISS